MIPFILNLLKSPKMLGALGIFALIGFLYFQNARIESLGLRNDDLKSQLAVAEYNIDSLDKSAREALQKARRNTEIIVTQQENTQLILDRIEQNTKIFTKAQHDLNNIAIKKPGLLEARVNKATLRVFTQIEEETRRFKEDL